MSSGELRRRARWTLLALAVAAACGGGGGGGSGSGAPSGSSGPPDASANVLPLSVNGAECGGTGAYPNEPCVRVTVCAPGTTQCTTINNVLLDTGSFGLRVFRQALGGLSLRQVQAPDGGALASCAQFADQSADWGPVQVADVVLGGEPAVQVPIQVIDSTFGAVPASCPQPEASPDVAGFNGILGVGVFREECGIACTAIADNGIYFSCQGSACNGTTVQLSDEVQNPVAHLPQDGNGVVIDLPAVDPGGVTSVEGQLLLGIGTQANNALAGTTTLPLDPRNGTLTTVFEDQSLPGSFIDTGSNGFFFPAPSSGALPACPGQSSQWYCPTGTVSFTATNQGFGGGSSTDVTFRITNFRTLASSGKRVFSDLAGTSVPGAGFDWGLPFFLGRKVAVGIDGASSSLGTGPFVAY
jgi:hypothetical protein